MPIPSFIFPTALWLLLLLFPVWAMAILAPRSLAPWQFWSSLVVRSLLVILLVLSLSGLQIVSRVDNLTTVFLIDSSDSVSPANRGRAEQFIQDALPHMQEHDQAAIVVFGEHALVERAPSSSTTFGRLTSIPVATRTNIEDAIQLGLALFPADSQKRLVLLSDGGENTGYAMRAAQLAAARNIPIDIVDLTGLHLSDEALITGLDIPSHVRYGQKADLVVMVESTVAQSAQLRIFANQEIIFDETVNLVEGANEFRTTVTAHERGIYRYRAQIEPERDARIQNNEVAAIVQVEGAPKILLVEGAADEARNLANALEASHIETHIVLPRDIPTDLLSLSAYDGVVLVNVPARDIPAKAMTALPQLVRDLGRGLMMIGGDRSYGVGGYGRTPIEEALPVYMDVRNREQRPNLAIVFIIDKSGSMDACHCSGPNRQTAQFQQNNDRKVDVAKEAVYQASTLLSQQDTLGIIAFDTKAETILPLSLGIDPDVVADAVADIQPIGNTNVPAGIQAAETMLQQTDARIKHAILLTDGWGSGGPGLATARRMREQGMTLSVVAAGGGSADYLENLATIGGGRYYPAEDMGEVPQIFLQETVLAAGNYLVERPFLPIVVGHSPILQGLPEEFPVLYGYNGSTLKDTARAILITEDQSPVLAQWHYGLGRSVAWTSDVKGQWGQDLVTWEEFPRFAAQMVDWMLPGRETGQTLTTDIRLDGGSTIITARVADVDGQPRDDVHVAASVIDSRPTEPHESLAQADLPLSQIGPGEYRTSIPNPPPGTYLLQVRGMQDGTTIAQETVGLVIPYSPEYRQDQDNPALLEALRHMTDGMLLEEPEAAFAPLFATVTRAHEVALGLLVFAFILLPIDIALRRLVIRRRDLAGVGAWVRGVMPEKRPPPSPDPTLERLAQAKQRALSRTKSAEGSPREQQPSPPQSTPPPTPKAQPPTDDDPLARLREAKERARRRARGEE